MSDTNETREEYIARMKALGYEPRFPRDNELFIDIDSAEGLEGFTALYAILEREFPDVRCDRKESSSGWPHHHIVVTLPFDVNPVTRIAWQAALNSDPARELLSLIRCNRGDIHPTLFIEQAAEEASSA